MAGDWIKVEKCSPDKPEVMRLARLWGIPQDQAFGALVRFWVWIDDACVDGVVDGVGSHEVDAMMHFPGFAMGLASVGWLHVDDAIPRCSLPNFDKHNSETSKKRALRNDRQARWRLNNVDAPPSTKASTREEKKREDKSNTKRYVVADAPTAKPASQGKTLDPLWTLPADWAIWALAERVDWTSADVERVALAFRDYWHAAAGPKSRKRDWLAAWRTWVRNEHRTYKARDPTLAERRANNMDILTGRTNGRERDITGIAERVDSAVVLPLASGIRKPDRDDVEGRGPERGSSALGG